MWISRQMSAGHGDSANLAEVGRVSMSGPSVAVITDRENRNVRLFSPGGYFWRPAAGGSVLVIKCDDGTRVVTGEPQNEPSVELNDGEVYITSGGGAAVHLRGDGCVNIIGNLLNNGAPLQTGGAPGGAG